MYNSYQTAADSVKNALISALNNDEDTRTLSEIWRHYLGLRAIADQACADQAMSSEDNITFNSSSASPFDWGQDGISFTGNPTATVVAADTVAISSLGGQDIITFN
jgi:hypothetical protein